MIVWAIKYENENCFAFAGGSFTTNISIASIYECESQALKVIKYYDLKDCKPVKVEIKEVEEV